MKAYINPEAFAYENSEGEDQPVSRKNAVFEDQARHGRETGVMKSPKFVREILHDFYNGESSRTDVAKSFVEVTPDGRVITTEPRYEEGEELG